MHAVSNMGRAELEREARNLGVARWESFNLSDLRKAVRRAREDEAAYREEQRARLDLP